MHWEVKNLRLALLQYSLCYRVLEPNLQYLQGVSVHVISREFFVKNTYKSSKEENSIFKSMYKKTYFTKEAKCLIIICEKMLNLSKQGRTKLNPQTLYTYRNS